MICWVFSFRRWNLRDDDRGCCRSYTQSLPCDEKTLSSRHCLLHGRNHVDACDPRPRRDLLLGSDMLLGVVWSLRTRGRTWANHPSVHAKEEYVFHSVSCRMCFTGLCFHSDANAILTVNVPSPEHPEDEQAEVVADAREEPEDSVEERRLFFHRSHSELAVTHFTWYSDLMRGVLPKEVFRFRSLSPWKKFLCVICVSIIFLSNRYPNTVCTVRYPVDNVSAGV